jgi:peptidoglycan-N-acetylglucosamine deacetylase
MQSHTKPIASLSLDLDDKWTYMKTHGDPNWSTYPSYLNIVVPRVLNILRRRGLSITFFVVGQDAAFSRNHDVLRSIPEAGHEVANHSFHHEPWLHLYSKQQLETELASAESAIKEATGCRPLGFRGPGFSVSETVIDTLIERGYRYDCSTLPTFLGPLGRMYYFYTAKLSKEEKKKRSKLFGTFADGFRPLKPYEWKRPTGDLLEIPVTTIPILRSPFHLSYLIHLATYSPQLAKLYLRIALALCRARGVNPSFLLHPLDFLAAADAPELAFFPGMRLTLEAKLAVAEYAFEQLQAAFDVLPMSQAASVEAKRFEAGQRILRNDVVPVEEGKT